MAQAADSAVRQWMSGQSMAITLSVVESLNLNRRALFTRLFNIGFCEMPERILAAPAGPAAILALIARPVASHQSAAFRTQRRIGECGVER